MSGVNELGPVPRPDGAPLVPPAPVDAVDLSVVVVVYNMRREAARTLLSLSRSYQQGIEDLSYEVIVVENGSSADQRLGDEFVSGFGPEFRYLDLAADATPSPTVALNRGIAGARGSAFALMIDGAHVLTPGVLRFGMVGLRSYHPAVVLTQQWYVGPGQQGDAIQDGYDQSVEDELFDGIEWPSDGHRLFDIGHFIGDRDWFDGLLESNCIFVPRALLEQVGGFDDSFSMPGGGYANLEFYERLASLPGVTLTSVLGEASFHQVHGGTTTNQDAEERRRRTYSYGEHYAELRGRPFTLPSKHMHYVGNLAARTARRTRSRRTTLEAFTKRVTTGPDGRPATPMAMPDELKTAFTEAFWHGLTWSTTTWLGRRVGKAPTDLFAYQELVTSLRPDWIIETGTGAGGRALFLASVCDALGHGCVVSVGDKHDEGLPQHHRIRYVHGLAHSEQAAERVHELVGPTPHALVLLGSAARRPRMLAEFKLYAPLVPVGSYLIVEDTIVNGHPVWPGFGPGPFEAVTRILMEHGEFVQDTSRQRFGLTFNPGGFLKRIK